MDVTPRMARGQVRGRKLHRILDSRFEIYKRKQKSVQKNNKKDEVKNNCGRNLGKCTITKGQFIEYGVTMEEKQFELIPAQPSHLSCQMANNTAFPVWRWVGLFFFL